MATHSSTLAWKIPWTKEPSRLQSMGSHRYGSHNFTLEHLFLIPMLFIFAQNFPVCPGVCKYIIQSTDRDPISYADAIGILTEALGYHVERSCGYG